MTYFDDTAYKVTAGNIVYAADLNDPLAAIETGIASLVSDIQTSDNIHYATDTGSADAYAVSLDPAPSAYSEGLMVWLKPANVNTGASTLNVNSLGAIAIKQVGLVALVAGDLPANFYACLKYADGVFQIVSNVGSAMTYAGLAASSASDSAVSAAAALVSENNAETAALSAASKVHNMIINGGLQHWQRGASHTSDSNSGYYAADRWFTLGNIGIARGSSGNGQNNYIELIAESSGEDNVGMMQGVELDVWDTAADQLKGKTYTLSYDIYTDTSWNGFTRVRYVDEVGSDSNAVTISAIDNTHSVTAGSWATVTKTFTISASKVSTSLALEVYIGLYNSGGVTSGLSHYLRDVKLEEASAATAFVLPDMGSELAKCQRYYWKGYAVGKGNGMQYGGTSAAGMLLNSIVFPVEMRDTPTCAIETAPSAYNVSGAALDDITTTSAIVVCTVTSAGRYNAPDGVYSANAEL